MIPVETGHLVATYEDRRELRTKLEYWETPYGVPTLGFTVEYYNDPSNRSQKDFPATDRVFRGKENILSFNWHLGAPPAVNSTDYFKARFYGYFYAEQSGLYTFYLSKDPTDYCALYVSNDQTIHPSSVDMYTHESVTSLDEWNSSSFMGIETRSVTKELTAGEWNPILIEFAERTELAYFIARYEEPNGEFKKILSAGVFTDQDSWENATDAKFIDPVEIDCAYGFTLNSAENESRTLEFSVPIVKESGNEQAQQKGFTHRNGLYYSYDLETYLRHGRLVRFSAGYSTTIGTPNENDLISKFEGVLTDIKTSKNENGESILNLTCQDILYNAISSINENYPDVTSYVANDFASNDEDGEPAGASRPVAYDAWPLEAVVRDLLVKSKIDPTKLYGKKKLFSTALTQPSEYSPSAVQVFTGGYLIDTKNILLKRRVKYGNPLVTNTEQADDEYIWASNFGEPLFDMLSKFSDTYGFVLGVNNEGNIKFESVNTPTIITGGDSSFDTVNESWDMNFDTHADAAKYYSSPVNDNTSLLTCTTSGGYFVVNLIKENLAWDDNLTSSWSIVDHEWPEGMQWDPNIPTPPSFRFCNILGRSANSTPIGGKIVKFDLFKYDVSTFYIRPNKSFTLESLEFNLKEDPRFTRFPVGTVVDVYIGRVDESLNPGEAGYDDLIGQILILENFGLVDFQSSHYNKGGGKIVVDYTNFATPGTDIEIVNSQTYGIRFVSKELDPSILPAEGGVFGLYAQDRVLTAKRSFLPGHEIVRTTFWQNTINPETEETGKTSTRYDGPNAFLLFYPDIKLRGFNTEENQENDNTCDIKLLAKRHNTELMTVRWFDSKVPNYYFDKSDTAKQFRYPSDGKDYTGVNPCKVVIPAAGFSPLTTGEIRGGYNGVQIRIKNNSSNHITRVTSIEAYDEDPFNPSWVFDTEKNLKNIQIDEGIHDTRNDVIVVGDLQGRFKDYRTDSVVNANNPSYQYVYSRATDISSINNPESTHNIGRKKPFLVYEPAIVEQAHADWFAREILYRYRIAKKISNFQSIGCPFVEVGDNIKIRDIHGIGNVNDGTENNQWVISISEQFNEQNYTQNIEATPYEPWSSFLPKPQPNPEDFGNNYFINIRMTDSEDQLRGYANAEIPPGNDRWDVYESETGNRLRVKYDQLVDGDLVIKVVRVISNQRKEIAYLVGGLVDGLETPEYRDYGFDYTLYWDGVDRINGNSRKYLGQNATIEAGETVVTIDDTDYVTNYADAGYYATSGDYYLEFRLWPRNKTLKTKTLKTTDLPELYNEEIYDRLYTTPTSDTHYPQTWQIKWGDQPSLTMMVSGQREGTAGGAERDVTYYPNHTFYDDENGGNGIKFRFELEGTQRGRTLYYKVNLDHYWAMGLTFRLRQLKDVPIYNRFEWDDIPTSESWQWPANIQYENPIHAWAQGLYYAVMVNNQWRKNPGRNIGTLRNINEENWREWRRLLLGCNQPGSILRPNIFGWIAPLVYAYTWYGRNFDTVDPADIQKASEWTLELDKRYHITLETSPDTGYRVTAWHNTPITHYTITDYIEQRKHVYSDDNKIEFYFNPTSPRAGSWVFNGLPDLTEEQYHYVKELMPLHAYLAGRDVADNPNKRLQFIFSHAFQVKATIWDGTGRLLKGGEQDIAKPTEHSHGLWSWSHTTNPTHAHNSRADVHFSPAIWNLQAHIPLRGKNEFYDMKNGEDYNYGTGYCNLKGVPNYGNWTWHGYWVSDDISETGIDARIPFNHVERGGSMLEGTEHWIRYEMEHPDRTVIPSISSTRGQPHNLIILDEMTQDWHWHSPIYEGRNYFPKTGTPDIYEERFIYDKEMTLNDHQHFYYGQYEQPSNTVDKWNYSCLEANKYTEDSKYIIMAAPEKITYLPPLMYQTTNQKGLYAFRFQSTMNGFIDSDTSWHLSLLTNEEGHNKYPRVPHGYRRYGVRVDDDFPKIWYRANINLSQFWDNSTFNQYGTTKAENLFWFNFLPIRGFNQDGTEIPGFEFTHGGWSEMTDKET